MSRFHRETSKCSGCPLRERRRVWGEGEASIPLAFFGEAPGQQEDLVGKPFVGPAGAQFDWALSKTGIRRASVWTGNTYCCRPPDNQYDSPEGEEAQLACRPGWDAELSFLQKKKVNTIVVFGANAMGYFGIEGSVGNVRGHVFQIKGFNVIPTYHPAFLHRIREKKVDNITADTVCIWLADFRKAKQISEANWHPQEEHFNVRPSLSDVVDFVDRNVRDRTLIGVDIEATGLDSDSGSIVVIGLASSPKTAISVPLFREGGGAYWGNGEAGEIRKQLNRLFSSCPLMFQNALYDVAFLKEEGYTVDYSNVQEDIMLLHHALQSEMPHRLGFIASVYGRVPYWKDDFIKRTGTILQMDPLVLRRYNLRDASVLHEVLPGMLQDLRERPESERVYREESLGLLNPVAHMEQTGIRLDQTALSRLRDKLTVEKATFIQQLRKLGSLPLEFNFDSDEDLRYFLYGAPPGKFKKLKELSEYQAETTSKFTKKGVPRPLKKETDKYRNLMLLQRLKEKTKSLYIPRGLKAKRTEGGAYSTDEQGRLGIQINAQNRKAELLHLKRPTDEHKRELIGIEVLLLWLTIYNTFSETSTILSTFTNYPVRRDGRVHTSFLIHGTATGRLSSNSPNLQNIPKEKIEVRVPFVATEGCVLLSRDYSNLEVWVLGYESKDDALISSLKTGVNIHDQNARILFQIDESSPNWTSARAAAKIFMFGGISYGGSDREIYQKVILKAPQLALTFKQFKEAKDRYMAAHPRYQEWRTAIEQHVYNIRTTSTFLGRSRLLFGSDRDILKQALNTPIQGGAAHVINRAMIALDKEIEKQGLGSRLLLQVHDELVFDVPKREVEIMLKLTKEHMEASWNFKGETVRFPTTVSIGPNWGSLTEVKE